MFRSVLLCSTLVAGVAAADVPEDYTNPPPLRSEKGYVTNVEVAIFQGPVEDVERVMRTPEGGVLAFAQATDRIPPIADITPISDAFPNEGALRRVTLEDGTFVDERVLEFGPGVFAYQIWNFSASNAWALDHIKGEFAFEDTGDGTTKVTWTYSIAPQVFFARPFIRGFLRNDFGPFMETGLQGAAEAYNSRVVN